MPNICIFCGANKGRSSVIVQQVEALCDLLIEREFDLVYGGGGTGLMGIIAEKFLNAGRKVIGVRPKRLITDEDAHENLTELVVTTSMSERKDKMTELSDAFIALPGGIGTLDEIIEVLTLEKIGYIRKPSAFLNTEGYYDHLKAFVGHMVQNGYLTAEAAEQFRFESSPQELMESLGFSRK